MTLQQMLHFSGSVLGPALLAQSMAEALRGIPEVADGRGSPRPSAIAERLLRQAFPNGLEP